MSDDLKPEQTVECVTCSFKAIPSGPAGRFLITIESSSGRFPGLPADASFCLDLSASATKENAKALRDLLNQYVDAICFTTTPLIAESTESVN
mgnify:CR=1 FL=1